MEWCRSVWQIAAQDTTLTPASVPPLALSALVLVLPAPLKLSASPALAASILTRAATTRAQTPVLQGQQYKITQQTPAILAVRLA